VIILVLNVVTRNTCNFQSPALRFDTLENVLYFYVLARQITQEHGKKDVCYGGT